MFLRGILMPGLWLSMLFAAWSVGGFINAQLRTGAAADQAMVLVHGRHLRRPAHSSHPLVDDGPTRIPQALQHFGLLPVTDFLPCTAHCAVSDTQRDLLSLTQQRRE